MKRVARLLGCVLLIGGGMIVPICWAEQNADTSEIVEDDPPPTRLLAKPKKEKAEQARQLLKAKGLKSKSTRHTQIEIIEVGDDPDEKKAGQLLKELRQSGLFEYVEPDVTVTTQVTPNDPQFPNLYGLTKISAPAAWNLQTVATNIIVAVVDTGVWRNHPDLTSNIWVNPATGTHGYRFINGIESTNPNDDHGHGTHVAGTIGAVGNNSLGVAGVNWTVKIAAFKFLDNNGSGQISDAVLCYDRIVDLKQAGSNIRVVNNSWGGGGFSQAFSDSVSAASAEGIVSVFAAGNNGANIDTTPFYPAAMSNVDIVSVVASDAADNRAGFSNYGYLNTDLAAPGVNIISTVPTNVCSLCDASGYRSLNGTSMATPHVAGAVAALLAGHPNLTPTQVRSILVNPGSYDALATTANQTSSGGRLNLYKLLTNPYLNNPTPNTPPILQQTGDAFVVAAGDPFTQTISVSDPNGDATRSGGQRNIYWLVNRQVGQLLPDSFASTVNFTAPALKLPVVLNYLTYGNDFHGGTSISNLTVQINSQAGLVNNPPQVNLSVAVLDPTNHYYQINWSATDSDSPGNLFYQVHIANFSSCCFNGPVVYGLAGYAGSRLRVHTYTMDTHLNVVENHTTIDVGTVTNGAPPAAAVALDRTSGTAPLTINFDLSSSTDADSSNLVAFVAISDTTDRLNELSPLVSFNGAFTGTVTLPQAGTYAVSFYVYDEKFNFDVRTAFVTALLQSQNPNPGALSVTPATTGQSTGSLGGPFSPGSFTYTLANTGDLPISWNANANQAWVGLVPASGSLAAGASTQVVATITSAANALAAGTYSNTTTFINTTTGIGNTTRRIVLTVNVNLAAPNNLAATPVAGAINLAWSDTAQGETSWVIERATKSGNKWSPYTVVATRPGNTTSYSNTGLTRNTFYKYRVKACTTANCGAYSNEAQAKAR